MLFQYAPKGNFHSEKLQNHQNKWNRETRFWGAFTSDSNSLARQGGGEPGPAPRGGSLPPQEMFGRELTRICKNYPNDKKNHAKTLYSNGFPIGR